MNRPRLGIREPLAALSLRERVILLCLLVLAVIYGADFLFNRLYLTPELALRRDIAKAEEQVRHQQRLLSREAQIHARYQRLDSPIAGVQDSVLTETEVLRELAELAGVAVHVQSVVPRLGNHAGQQIMFVALDFEGSFSAVLGYLEKILNEMPSEVASLSLVPRSGAEGGVVCRLSIRVDCFES